MLFSLQEAKIKDKQEPNVDVELLQKAYLHPSIVAAPMASDSDDDPDTIKNGTAPGGSPDTSSPGILKKRESDSSTGTPNESTNKGLHDNSPRPTSPHRQVYRENSGSSGNSRRRSKRLSGSHSPAFYAAGSYISSPALSRASSNAVYMDGASSLASLPREEIAPGSQWSSPYRPRVDETGRRHFTSPEAATLRENQTTSVDSPTLEVPQSVATPHSEGNGDRREDRGFERPFTGTLQAPLGHVEP